MVATGERKADRVEQVCKIYCKNSASTHPPNRDTSNDYKREYEQSTQ